MTIEELRGKRVRLLGKHPFAGDSAEILDYTPGIGMKVKLLRGDAMYGHESFVTNAKEMRFEKEGLDW